MTNFNNKECGAKRRKREELCKAPAMRNGRCRLHGGKSFGGFAHPNFTHGQRSKDPFVKAIGWRAYAPEKEDVNKTLPLESEVTPCKQFSNDEKAGKNGEIMKPEKPLSEKHKRFVQLVINGKSATSAYAAAYNIPNSKATRAASCRLMKDARIIAAITKSAPRDFVLEGGQVPKTAKRTVKRDIVNKFSPIKPLTFINKTASNTEPKNLGQASKVESKVPAEARVTNTENMTKYDRAEERPDAAEIERKIRETIGESVNNPLTFSPPKYQRPPAPTEAELLRRRLRHQAINPKPKGEW